MPRERKTKDNKTDTEESVKTKRFTSLKSILERLDGFSNETKHIRNYKTHHSKL